MLGFADGTCWCNLERYHGFSKPEGPASESIGLNFYGDEGQIFDQSEYVCVNWGSELTPFPTNSLYSIFFRPTPYGFRQVVQHVSKHVAYEIN